MQVLVKSRLAEDHTQPAHVSQVPLPALLLEATIRLQCADCVLVSVARVQGST
jgi:hypothetical protein